MAHPIEPPRLAPNKLLSCPSKISVCLNNFKNKTNMSLPGFHTFLSKAHYCLVNEVICEDFICCSVFKCLFIDVIWKKKIHKETSILYRPLQSSSLVYLTFTTLWANSAEDKLMIFFPQNRIDILCKVPPLKCQIGRLLKILPSIIFWMIFYCFHHLRLYGFSCRKSV